MKRTTLPLASPILTAMHPGNPHGLRYAEGDTGDKGADGKQDGQQDDPPKVNEHGYPDSTPVKDMTVEQQAAYHQHHSRKWEQRAKARDDYDDIKAERDRLKQAGMTDAEKAIEDARNEGRAAGRAESVKTVATTKIEAALSRRGLTEERIAALVGPLDHNYFLTDTGEVDAAKVSNYASGFGQEREQWPDMGQGNRGNHAAEKGVGAGRDLFRDRTTKK